jgi:hypothetical protein
MKNSLRDLSTLLVVVLSFSPACFEDGNGSQFGPDITGTPPGDVTRANSSAKFEWSIPASVPSRNPECKPVKPEVHGPSVPWSGFTHKGLTYTCNKCPGGDELLQGEWRAVFDVDDPTVPYEGDPTFREYIQFNGNTFRNILEGEDLGTKVGAVIEGWFFCSSKPETVNETKFFVLTKVEPEGAFGWETGFVYSADTLMSDPNNMLLGWYDGVVTSAGGKYGGTAPYCRIGSEVGDIPCTDPFK